MSWQLQTAVVLIIFRRPDTTSKVFEAIRSAKPPKLFVIADGPRADRPDDVEKCASARAIIDQVDWECEIFKNYSETNMGLKHRVSTGLDWVFNTVEEAIILEDDCFPDPSFFRFCQELLEKYKHDERIMMIGGTNVLLEWKSSMQSYCFSYFNSCWGWASWRRAWNHYDIDMGKWTDIGVKSKIRKLLADDKKYRKCERVFDLVYREEMNSWALRWFFARLAQAGLTITPSVNLISNIGFTIDGTHHQNSKDKLSNLTLQAITFPLLDPPNVAIDQDFEDLRFKKTWGRPKTPREIIRRVKRFVLTGK